MSLICNWSSAEDEILIDFVRNREAIYNIKSKDYRKNQLKQNWWRQIGETLNKTDIDCSKRWSYIRDYYIRRKGKPGTGSSGETAKKRSDLLSFLDNFPTAKRMTVTNIIDESYGTPSSVGNEIDGQTEDGSIENTPNSSIQTQNILDTPCGTDENINRKRLRRNNNSNAEERLKLLKQIVAQNSQKELDENDHFFNSMAKIVNKLPRYQQAELRLQIGSLVGNAELKQIKIDSTQSGVPSPEATHLVIEDEQPSALITIDEDGDIYLLSETN